MRILLDNCVDRRFANLLSDYEVFHCRQMGWSDLSNGKLLTAAEEAGFDVMVTVDKNVRFQQNLSKRKISLITLNPILVELEFIAPLVPKLSIVLVGLHEGSSLVIEP